MSLDYLTKQV